MNRTEQTQLLEAVLAQVHQECLANPQALPSDEPQISQQSFATLAAMFGTVLSPALEILDQGKVTKFVCQQSRRHFFRVKEPKRVAGKSDKDEPDVFYDVS